MSTDTEKAQQTPTPYKLGRNLDGQEDLAVVSGVDAAVVEPDDVPRGKRGLWASTLFWAGIVAELVFVLVLVLLLIALPPWRRHR